MRQMLAAFGYYLLSRDLIPALLLNGAAELVDRSLLLALLRQLEINCLIDVGAHTGSFAANLRRLGYEGRIISFEPTPDSFRQLSARMRRDPKWTGYNVALGAETRETTLNVAALSNLNSLLAPVNFDVTSTTPVSMTRLDAIFDRVVDGVAEPRVFLKIDTQGYDLEVVRGATGCIDRIVGLQSEISVQAVYRGMIGYLEALAYYESVGFRLANLTTASRHRRTSRIIEFDCLMYREAQP
jgi:FkbM family methyltransferase